MDLSHKGVLQSINTEGRVGVGRKKDLTLQVQNQINILWDVDLCMNVKCVDTQVRNQHSGKS